MFSYLAPLKFWDTFFFEEKPTQGVAVFRIIWSVLILIYFLLDLYNVDDFYGPHALTSLETVRQQFPYIHANVFHFFGASYEVTYALLTVYGIAILFTMIGLFTKSSLVVMIICMTSFHQRNIWLLSSSEVLMRSVSLLLLFTPCGQSLSIDSIVNRSKYGIPKKLTSPVWGLRMIQIQISVIYLWTVWHKLKGETWYDGTAVYYATRLESMTNLPLPYLMDSVFFLKAATWGTLITEFSLGVLIWFKEFRKPVIIIGIIFHLGIEYLMSIPFFELYMIALLLNFYTPEEHAAFIEKLHAFWSRGLKDIPTLKKSLIKS